MKDNLSIVITAIIFVILVVLFPLYNYFERQDNMSYNLVLKATTNFVDEILNCGYIDQYMYSKYVSQIAVTGNMYDIQLETHKKLIADTSVENVYQDQYLVDYNDDIFESETGKAKENKKDLNDKSIKNGIYKLDTGDEVYIKIKNSSTTTAEALFKNIVPLSSSKNISVNYGGIVKNNAWLKAESGVVSKELITVKFETDTGNVEKKQYLYYGDNYVTFDITDVKPNTDKFKGWREKGKEENSELFNEDKLQTKRNMTLVAIIETARPIVKFNVNGGNPLAENEKEYNANDVFGEMPTPERDGYKFIGWYTDVGNLIDANQEVGNHNIELIAHWEKTVFEVILDPNGGTFNSSDSDILYVEYGKKYGELPKPNNGTYIFEGWYDSNNNKIDNNSDVTIKEDHTLTAKWNDSKIKVTYDLRGGTLPDGEESYKNVYKNSNYGYLPTPKKDNYEFQGWYPTSEGGLHGDSRIESTTKVTKTTDHKIYAIWIAKKITVTFNANGGKFVDGKTIKSSQYYYGNKYNIDSIINVVRDHCTFEGWYDTRNNKITSTSTVQNSTDHSLYAHWKANSGYLLTGENVSGYHILTPSFVDTSKSVNPNTLYEKASNTIATINGKSEEYYYVKDLKNGSTYFIDVRAFK